MARIKILMADNDPDFLETRREFLEKEGYEVVTASSPFEAQERLQEEDIALAIIDIRLLNDDDEKDVSGLELAKNIGRSLPVLILTGYPAFDYARQALRFQADGVPAVHDFIAKEEGPIALLSSIRKILDKNQRTKLSSKIRRVLELTFSQAHLPLREQKAVNLNVPEQMHKDYEKARLHAHYITLARLGLVMGGSLVFLVGIMTFRAGRQDVGTLTAIGGAIVGTLGGLYTKLLSTEATRRWEQFHKELMLLYKNDLKRKSDTERRG